MTNSGEHNAVPPPVELPRLVDALNDDVYSKIRARHAYLEDWRVRQQHENGKLIGRFDDHEEAIARVRRLHSPVTVYASADRCGCPKQGHDYHNTEETERGDDVCINTPIGEVCDICRVPDGCEADSLDGDHVNWPCPTYAALDGDTPKETA